MKTYKIRRFQNGKSKAGNAFFNYSLTIPTEIAEKLPKDMRFSCELTDVGILFRPATEVEEPVQLPTWAKDDNGNGESPAKKASRPRPGATTKT